MRSTSQTGFWGDAGTFGSVTSAVAGLSELAEFSTVTGPESIILGAMFGVFAVAYRRIFVQ